MTDPPGTAVAAPALVTAKQYMRISQAVSL